MKKTRRLSLLLIGFLLFLPFIRFSRAQGAYVGIQDTDAFLWELRLYPTNWVTYFADDLETMLETFFPLGVEYNMTKIFGDWSWTGPPQSYWPLTVSTIGIEGSGQILLPYDPTIITYSPVNGTAGYEIPIYPVLNDYWDSTWYIVNDSSSFLRQTLGLTLAFSAYGIMGAPFVPTTINWTAFAAEANSWMAFYGGFYANVSVTSLGNGYSIYVPTFGFENNTALINIDVAFDTNGVLTYYQFTYGSDMLIDYILVEPTDPVITSAPSDLTIEEGYTGQYISWIATDLSPNTYSIDRQDIGNVAGPSAWLSGTAITYNIPTGLTEGNYTYTITITDDYGGSVTDSVTVTVEKPEPEPETPPIPGFELSIVIGVSAIVVIGLIVLMKKKNR
ncbi:MAG: hypothetical protein ACFE9Q_12215 [Candidatus Hodarchaeota archaeon]